MPRNALKMSVNVLDWAATQIGETLSTVAPTLASRASDRDRILRGELTVPQAEKLAKRTGVPFGFLFLSDPPTIAQPQIPDLRQRPQPDPLSKDFFDVLSDVENKQQWYIDYLASIGENDPNNVVGRFDPAEKPKAQAVAEDMRDALKLSPQDRRSSPTADQYFSLIAKRAESLGVLVMKSGIVKSNTRRQLSTREFQGFALADKIAPLVFVNGRDYEVASVFTIAHELAHIWLGQSAVTDKPQTAAKGVERLCNEIAAELLVPRAQFLAAWRGLDTLESVASQFRVSRWVIAIRAFELDKISEADLDATMSVRFTKKKTTGGDGLKTIPVRNSKRLTSALVSAAMSGRILIRDAAALLNVKPNTVMSLAKQGKSVYAE